MDYGGNVLSSPPVRVKTAASGAGPFVGAAPAGVAAAAVGAGKILKGVTNLGSRFLNGLESSLRSISGVMTQVANISLAAGGTRVGGGSYGRGPAGTASRLADIADSLGSISLEGGHPGRIGVGEKVEREPQPRRRNTRRGRRRKASEQNRTAADRARIQRGSAGLERTE